MLVNAAQAIPEHGDIWIRTCQVDDMWVKLEIEDNGSGIPPEIQKRIFKPLF
ncbi:MAG: ATPase, partial [Lentisphaerae bacterium]